MSADTLFDQPTTTRLHGLIKSIQAGKLLFPDFQRPFIWKDEQRKLLFDSILRGLPIGSLLVWRTTIKLKIQKELGPFPLPQPSSDSKEKYYVLDGLQRLSTLYAALAGETRSSDTDRSRRWPIYYDLEMDLDDGDHSRFKLARRDQKPPVEWLPLYLVFDGKGFWKRQRDLYELGMDVLAERAEQIVNQIKDYSVAIVPILTDDINLATQSFQRINSSGTPMSEVHMLRALIYGMDLDLTRHFKQFAESLSWDGGIAPKTLVNTLKAVRGLNIYRADLDDIAKALRNDESILPLMEYAVEIAVDFCVSCGVRSEAALPYTYQLVALARAAANEADLNSYKKPLSKWFWATTYTEYFTGMTAGQLREAFDHVEEICKGAAPYPPDMPDACAPLEWFNSTSVRSLALMHRLSRRKLIDFEGKEIRGTQLIARGRSTFAKLLIDAPAYDPANRILVAPEEATATRRILFDSEEPLSDALREAHLLPPWDDHASDATESMLAWRREKLRRLEVKFIKKRLGLEVRSES